MRFCLELYLNENLVKGYNFTFSHSNRTQRESHLQFVDDTLSIGEKILTNIRFMKENVILLTYFGLES